MKALLPLVLLVGGFTAGLAVTGRMYSAAVSPAHPVPPASVQPLPAQDTRAQTPSPAVIAPIVPGAPDFTRIASLAVKTVTNISSVQLVRRPSSPFANDPFFRYFFGDDTFGTREQRSASLGSGVIVSSDGYVVTNSHVVGENARRREVTVSLADKREVPGTVIGTDPPTDLALLKIDVRNLPSLRWGDSSQLQVGEWVLAIGSPFQLSQTVTAGIVSATGRANVGFAAYEDFIQTDAAINPGNSGGALINTRGELVGINTGIFSQSGGYQGIGFAVPSLLARRVVDDLIEYGEVRRGTISWIAIEPMNAQIAEQLGAPDSTGVLIVQIAGQSNAYGAGLRRWDVIVEFNGEVILDPSQLFRLVSDAPIGSEAQVTVWRNGDTVDLNVPIVAASRQSQ
jgi:Do/DeqQ family serine protease